MKKTVSLGCVSPLAISRSFLFPSFSLVETELFARSCFDSCCSDTSGTFIRRRFSTRTIYRPLRVYFCTNTSPTKRQQLLDVATNYNYLQISRPFSEIYLDSRPIDISPILQSYPIKKTTIYLEITVTSFYTFHFQLHFFLILQNLKSWNGVFYVWFFRNTFVFQFCRIWKVNSWPEKS